MKVDNAVIMAAGTSSRFAPLSFEKHKAMTMVKGEVLIERQIEQLNEAGILDVYVVTGYKAEQFDYLTSKYGVKLIHNPEYLSRNNNGSIWAVRSLLANSFICSADNYFSDNPFEKDVKESYYAAEYAEGRTEEWCMTEDEEGYINSVTIGGEKKWYMLGHTFWSENFSKEFINILDREYNLPGTAEKLWESIFIEHLDALKMRIKKYNPGIIYEFDTLDELRLFDNSYVGDTRSRILKQISEDLHIMERDIINISSLKSGTTEATGFEFDAQTAHYIYIYDTETLEKVSL